MLALSSNVKRQWQFFTTFAERTLTKEIEMACRGGSQGVMAELELDKISNEIKELISQIETDFEVDAQEFDEIRAKLKDIMTQKPKS
jgi:DNA-directed RNA polymerase specialized sigma subunit